jgi:hypothetical protein
MAIPHTAPTIATARYVTISVKMVGTPLQVTSVIMA